MHSLSELKQIFEERGFKIKKWEGWILVVGKDKYTMLNDEYYINNILIKRKELLASIKVKKKESR